MAVTFFSPSLTTYRGSLPVDMVLERLLAIGSDLPPNLAANDAAFSRLKSLVAEDFTQLRSNVKKNVCLSSCTPTLTHVHSIQIRDSLMAPPRIKGQPWQAKIDSEATNIYKATVTALEGTPCKVSPELCGRYAIFVRLCYVSAPRSSPQCLSAACLHKGC